MRARKNERIVVRMFPFVFNSGVLPGCVEIFGIALGKREIGFPLGVREIVSELTGVGVGLWLGQILLGEPAQTYDGVA